MNSKFTRVFVFLLLTFFLRAAYSASLADLDQVLTKAKDLNEFLQSPQLIEEYYKIAAEYYGAQVFPRESYNKIIEQMRVMNRALPDFAQRSWETNTGKQFSVVSAAPTFGRTVNISAWENYLKSYLEDLEKKSNGFSEASLELELRNLKQQMQDHETTVGNGELNKNARKVLVANFYENLKKNESLAKAASYLLMKHFKSEQASEILESGNADLILNYLLELRQDPLKFLRKYSIDERLESLLPIIKNQLPQANNLQKDDNLFPRKKIVGANGKTILAEGGAPGEIHFIPTPRRFHGFFKGISINECVGGCSKNLGSLTPERWATVILNNTEFHFIEKNSRFSGWVQATPIMHNQEIYASVDFGSTVFRQNLIERSEDGTLKSNTMVSGWLKQAMKAKPENWQGFMVGESNAINNGGALPAVRSSPAYMYGEKFAPNSKPFSHADPNTVNRIKGIYKAEGHAANYAGSMIFDAAVPTAGTLTKLKIVDRTLYSLVKEAIKENNANFINGTLNTIRIGAVGNLGNEVLTLRNSGVLKILSEAGYKVPIVEADPYSKNPADYIKYLIDKGLTLQEMKWVQNLLCSNVDTSMAFSKALIKTDLVFDADSFVKAISYELKKPSDAYVKAKTENLREWVPELIKSVPGLTADHIRKLAFMSGTVETGILLLEQGLLLVKNSDEFIKLFEEEYKRGNDIYKAKLAELIYSNINTFFGKNPKNEDIIDLYNKYGALWSNTQKVAYLDLWQKSQSQMDLSQITSKINDEKLKSILFVRNLSKQEQSTLSAKLAEVQDHLDINSGWDVAYEKRVSLTTNLQDLSLELSRYPQATKSYAEAIAKTFDRNLSRFLAMNPDHKQLIHILEKTKMFEKTSLTLIEKAVDSAKNVNEFIAPFLTTKGYWSTQTFNEGRREVIRKNLTRLSHFPDTYNQISEILKLPSYSPLTTDLVESFVINHVKAILKKSNNPEEFLKLIEYRKLSGSKFQDKLDQIARENYQSFVNSRPTSVQLKTYKAAYYKMHERVSLWFVKPGKTAEGANSCKLVFAK